MPRSSRILLATTSVIALGAAIPQALAAGSLSISPVVIAHDATPGAVGALVVSNATASALKITVTPRPWLQGPTGAVSPDRSLTLVKYVSVSARSFSLAPGTTRTVAVTLLGPPPGGSLYGNLEVIGTPPTVKKKQSGIVAIYRLVGSLRLNPVTAKRKVLLKVGAAKLVGTKTTRSAVVAISNAGNVIDATSGSAKLVGPRGTARTALAAVRIVPGHAIQLTLSAAKQPLPKGSYTATINLSEAGKKFKVTRHLTVP